MPRVDPGWGNVYDYDNMHGDLVSNGGEDFDNATCDKYYEMIETQEFEDALEEAFGEGADDGY